VAHLVEHKVAEQACLSLLTCLLPCSWVMHAPCMYMDEALRSCLDKVYPELLTPACESGSVQPSMQALEVHLHSPTGLSTSLWMPKYFLTPACLCVVWEQVEGCYNK